MEPAKLNRILLRRMISALTADYTNRRTKSIVELRNVRVLPIASSYVALVPLTLNAENVRFSS